MECIYPANSFKSTLMAILSGFAMDAMAGSFPLPNNYEGYSGECDVIASGKPETCDWGHNGNNYFFNTTSPSSGKSVYFRNGPGAFHQPIPKIIFASEFTRDADQVTVRSYASGGSSESKEAKLGKDGRATLERGTSGSYYYNIEMINNSKFQKKVRYHVCSLFYSYIPGSGDKDGDHCGTLPDPRPPETHKTIMCGSGDSHGIIIGLKRTVAKQTEYDAPWRPASGPNYDYNTLIIPESNPAGVFPGPTATAITCTNVSGEKVPFVYAGTYRGNFYYLDYKPRAWSGFEGYWKPMNRPEDNKYPITAMTTCRDCSFAYAGDSNGQIYMAGTRENWAVWIKKGGAEGSPINALTMGSYGNTNAVYAAGNNGRVWIAGNSMDSIWVSIPISTTYDVSALAANAGSRYIYASSTDNKIWRAEVDMGAGAHWFPIGEISSTTIKSMFITNIGASSNRYVYAGNSAGETWVGGNDDTFTTWKALPIIPSGQEITSFAQSTENTIEVMTSDGARYKRNIKDDTKPWEHIDTL